MKPAGRRILLCLLFALVLASTEGAASDFYVRTLGDDGAAGTSPATAWQTISGIIVSATDGAVIEFCHPHHNGGINSQNSGGPVGIWAWQSNDVVMQFNISHHNRTGGGADGGGFDLDGGITDSVMQMHSGFGRGRPSSTPASTSRRSSVSSPGRGTSTALRFRRERASRSGPPSTFRSRAETSPS